MILYKPPNNPNQVITSPKLGCYGTVVTVVLRAGVAGHVRSRLGNSAAGALTSHPKTPFCVHLHPPSSPHLLEHHVFDKMSSKDNPNDPNNSPNKMNHPLGSKENSWTLETDSLDAAIEKPKAKPAPVELDLHYNLNGEQAASLLMNLARSSSSVERKPTDTSFSTSLEVAEARRHARDSATSVVNNNHFGSHGTAGAVMAAQRITFTPAAEMETGRLVRLAQSTFGNSVNFDEDDFVSHNTTSLLMVIS